MERGRLTGDDDFDFVEENTAGIELMKADPEGEKNSLIRKQKRPFSDGEIVSEEKTYNLTPGNVSTSILSSDVAVTEDDALDLSQISQASRGSRYENLSSFDESNFVDEGDREEGEEDSSTIQLLHGEGKKKKKKSDLIFRNREKDRLKEGTVSIRYMTPGENSIDGENKQNRGSRVGSGLSSMTRFLKNSVTSRRNRNINEGDNNNNINNENNRINETLLPIIDRGKRANSPSIEADLFLKIKTVADGKEYPLSISSLSSVLQLKYLIMSTLKIENKLLRLIYQGKMLSPDTALLESFKIPIYIGEKKLNNNTEIIQNEGHNSLNNDQPPSTGRPTTTTPVFIHCVISDMPPPQLGHLFHRASSIFGSNQGSTVDDGLPIVDDIPPDQRRGLDTLRNYNLSQEEVMALRSYFSESINAYAATQPRVQDEEDNDRRYRMEEEWMAQQGETSEYAVNVGPVIRRNGGSLGNEEEGRHRTERFPHHGHSMPQGDGRDFTWGFILGFCLGIIMLLWLFTPDGSMSYQQRMGILVGVSCQLAWSIMARSLYTSDVNPHDNERISSTKDD